MTRQHTKVFGWTLAVVVAALFCLLGGWQLQRMHEKQALLAQSPVVGGAAVSLSQAAASPQELHWVRERLRFLPGTVLLDNQLRDGRAGIKVYQAARAHDGLTVLVDLGWLPVSADRVLPPVIAQQGMAELQGL